MEEIIKITEKDGKRAVNARELHHILDIGKDFSTWIKDRISKYDFVENQDYEVFTEFGENSQGERPLKEYALSIITLMSLWNAHCLLASVIPQRQEGLSIAVWQETTY